MPSQWRSGTQKFAFQLQNFIFYSAKDLGDNGWDKYYGWGRVDAQAAINAAIQGGTISSSPTPDASPSSSLSPSPSSTTIPPGKSKNTPKRR